MQEKRLKYLQKSYKSAKNVSFSVKSGENICKYGSFVVLLQHKYCDKG